MKCRDCGQEIYQRNFKGGYINQCDKCARAAGDVPKYIGVHGVVNKSANIEVHRTNLKNVARYNRNGAAVHCGISSTEKEEKE